VSDDEPVVRLADFRQAPPIGDPAYENVLRCTPTSGAVYEFRNEKADQAIDAALSGGIKLEHLTASIVARRNACGHAKTTINETARTLRCNDCGADIDPFAKLLGIAYGNERLLKSIVERDRLERQIQNLRAQLEVTKGEEKRSKSRASAAKKAREKALRSDPELYELNLFRDLYDATRTGDRTSARRLQALLVKINDARREAEAQDAEPPTMPTPVQALREGTPDG
jgi:hypothetical protein